MALKYDTAKFEECLKLASEAKDMQNKAKEFLKQAKSIEKKAVESFRKIRQEMLEALNHEKEKILEEKKTLENEYFGLTGTFCEQMGHHTCTFRTVRTSNKPLYHTFAGYEYPTKTFETCLICGHTNDPENLFKPREYYNPKSKDIIQKASEQTENLELKKTALRILEIPKEFDNINDRLKENSKGFKEICSLFGHDADIISYDCEEFKCKCCGKQMSYDKYINAHYRAKYKGGIVPFYYHDDNFIL